MGSWFKKFEALIWAATIAFMSLAWIYATFTTKEALAQKEVQITQMVELKHAGVVGILTQMQDTLNKIDERTYQLAKDKK